VGRADEDRDLSDFRIEIDPSGIDPTIRVRTYPSTQPRSAPITPMARPSDRKMARISRSSKPRDFRIAISRAFSKVMVEMMLKMPKPATTRMPATMVNMMMLRTKKISSTSSLASCQDSLL